MKRQGIAWSLCLACVLSGGLGYGQELKPLELPKPRTEGGKPLMQVLKERKSGREFSPERLSPQQLSDLLWAAFGVSRPDGRRTAPSASNQQEIDIYVALPEGVYLYEAGPHRLAPVAAGDLRGKAGTQAFVAEAALNLIYVAKLKPGQELAASSANVDTGFIGQNVYLFCASEGLATVFRGSVDREGLSKALGLRPEQKVTYSQSVGYPKK
jgi:nitroreductase